MAALEAIERLENAEVDRWMEQALRAQGKLERCRDAQ